MMADICMMIFTVLLIVIAIYIAAYVFKFKKAPWPVVAWYWFVVASKYVFEILIEVLKL